MPPPNTRNKYLLPRGLISTTVGSPEAVSEAVIQADSLLWKRCEEKERSNKVNHKCDKAL